MTANSENNKEKKRGNVANLKPFRKGDPRINRKGAPKRGTTLTDAYKDILDKFAEEAAEIFGGNKTEIGRFFLQLPKGIPLRYLMAGRNVTAEIAEPNARRQATIWDRLEGKVPQTLQGPGEGGAHLIKTYSVELKDEDE